MLDSLEYIEQEIKLIDQLIFQLKEVYELCAIERIETCQAIKSKIISVEHLRHECIKKKDLLEDLVYSLKQYENYYSNEFEEIAIRIRRAKDGIYG